MSDSVKIEKENTAIAVIELDHKTADEEWLARLLNDTRFESKYFIAGRHEHPCVSQLAVSQVSLHCLRESGHKGDHFFALRWSQGGMPS